MVCLRNELLPQVPKGGSVMLDQYAIVPYVAQAKKARAKKAFEVNELSEQYGMDFVRFLSPLLRKLYQTVDIRPLRTLVQTVEAILTLRDQSHGLLLSELGDHMDGLQGGGGGTKRLETVIHHQQWKAQEIDEFLLWRVDQHMEQWKAQREDGLMLWDGTILEKPESVKAEGLCAVRSSKAGRLTHVKKGYYHPPGAPIFVPGMHGIGLRVSGRAARQGPAMLAALRWWTSRGPMASYEKDEHCKLLRLVAQRWGQELLHIFDRGDSRQSLVGGPAWLRGAFCLALENQLSPD